MLKKRIIICLDVRDGKVTKGVRFKENKDLGDPVDMARDYYEDGVDELVFYDITASAEHRSIMIHIVEDVAKNIFVPFSVGGGIRSVQDMDALLRAGAEKVSVNSAAVPNPDLIDEGAKRFGTQCIVLGMDVLADPQMPSAYRVVIRGGREKTEKDALQWAKEAVDRGAGEIVLNSIDADGTKEGYDCTLTKRITDAVSVPVVASGGAGTTQHIVDVFQHTDCSAALVASMVHYGTHHVQDIKKELKQANISIRE